MAWWYRQYAPNDATLTKLEAEAKAAKRISGPISGGILDTLRIRPTRADAQNCWRFFFGTARIRPARTDDTQHVDAAEIRIRAERRLGRMLLEQKETVGFATGGDATKARFLKSTELKPTLADVGIDKKLSMRSQKVADISDETFEGMMGLQALLSDNGTCSINCLIAHPGLCNTACDWSP
jgi:hypothetical protein